MGLLIFVLNGVIFILIGLQLSALREAIPHGKLGSLLVAGTLISATAILVRLLWVPLAAVIPRWLSAALRARDPMPPWSHVFLTSWIGMRGIVTLAAAMALSVTTAAGTPFPFRAEIILISFAVILATLVLQGLSLPPVIRALHLVEGRELDREEVLAREHATTAALNRLDQLAGEEWPRADQVERLRVQYVRRLERFAGNGAKDGEQSVKSTEAFQQLRHETLTAERLALIELRNNGAISDEVLHRLEHELDVEALRKGVGERRAGGSMGAAPVPFTPSGSA